MSGYREEDAARDTGASTRQTADAWHKARDDAKARDEQSEDRPTPENERDGRRLTERIMERSRRRGGERDDRERSER
jgi:hypothetical protein